jgi:hypothetical protein
MRPILVKDNRVTPESKSVQWKTSEKPLRLAGGTHLFNQTIIAENSISQSAKPNTYKTYFLHPKTPYNKGRV